MTPIWLCADDYGISPAVSKAIRELIERGRLNATSVMVVAPALDHDSAAALSALGKDGRRLAIGLHVTLTGRFKPLTTGYRPVRHGNFVSLAEMMVRGSLRLLNRDRLAGEIGAQLKAFTDLFGRAPDFVDGHQHSHLFPQVREAFLHVVKQQAPQAWVRQCGRAVGVPRSDYKADILDALSRRFRRLAAHCGVQTNPAFAGTYDFNATPSPDFAKLFPGFLKNLPPKSVVMCHPGFVDAELERLDPLTSLREREFAYLAGDTFPAVLGQRDMTLE
jgi:chitin disaccharide deacetylase